MYLPALFGNYDRNGPIDRPSERPTNQPKDQQTEIMVHRKIIRKKYGVISIY